MAQNLTDNWHLYPPIQTLFYEYLKEKNIQEPHDKKELVQVLKSFYVEAR